MTTMDAVSIYVAVMAAGTFAVLLFNSPDQW